MNFPPELEQVHCRIAARSHGPQRRLSLGEQLFGGGYLADFLEDVLKVFPVSVGAVVSPKDKSSCVSSASLRRSPCPARQHSSIRSLSSMKRTKTQANTHASATC